MLGFLGIVEMDKDILLYIQDHWRGGFFDGFFSLITHLGDVGIFWMVLTAILLCFKKTRKAGFISAIALVGSVLLNNVILKNLIGRERPYNVFDELHLLKGIKEASDASFPSGHTAASFASCVAILPNVKKRWWAPLILMAVLISFSRIYIGIHYPSDIVGGFVSGVILGILANVIGNYIINKLTAKAHDSEGPLRFFGAFFGDVNPAEAAGAEAPAEEPEQ